MSTHRTFCVVCGTTVYCSGDNHALGCGGDHGEGGCDNAPYIEFCSLEHAMELKRRLGDAIANYLNVHGDCSRLNCSECRALRSDPPLYYPKRAIMPDDELMDLSYFFAKRGE